MTDVGQKKLSMDFFGKIFLGKNSNVWSEFFFARFFCQIFLWISSSWVKIRLHNKNKLPGVSGSALKVCGSGGC